MAKALAEELRDRVRLYDQMCTMHSMMRDRFAGRARVLDLTLLVASGCLAAVTFVGNDIVTFLGLTQTGAKVLLGAASTLVFVAGLAVSRVDWKAAAERHGRASSTFADLKARARSLATPDGNCDEAETQEYLRQAATIVGTLPEIPEAQFLRLKAAHLRKIALSRLLDRTYAAPLWLLRLNLMWRHSRNVRRISGEAQ